MPRAMAVRAIDDCTVDGRAHRNKMPMYRSGVRKVSASGRSARPRSGNRTKVLASTSKCKRQCMAPATTASRDSLAPCRKNRAPMATVVMLPKTTAVWPVQGRKVASATVTSRAMVKLSGFRLRSRAAGEKEDMR
ncbi:hypothetical protein D3C72_1960910 [compost metagenome]